VDHFEDRWLRYSFDLVRSETQLKLNQLFRGAAFLAILNHYENLNGNHALMALTMSWSFGIVQGLPLILRMATDLDMSMSAVWRILDYEENLTHEASFDHPKAPAQWPNEGKVEAKRIAYRYRPELPKVLHDISFSIKSHEKIGIVGRTGSGKSTLTLAMLRILEIARKLEHSFVGLI
jgi:ABC-type multidrug transport system fused ATPase/permease subunit